MLILLCHIALSITLLIAFYQDWKYRAITWLLFPILGIITVLLFSQTGLSYNTIVANIVFLTTLMGCLFVYMSLKEKKAINIFKAGFGLGDVLFLLAVTPLFGSENYILFFISGMIFSGIFHLILTKGNRKAKIPLAGYLAVYLLILKGINLIFSTNIFYAPIR